MAVTVPFTTISEMFQNITARYLSETKPVLMFKEDGIYKGISYAELRRRVELFALGLAALGLKRGDRVSIISENRPEWVIADQAIVALGGINVPIYPTMTAKQNEYIFNDAGVRFAIVSNQFQLKKVVKAAPEVPSLEKTILMSEKGPITERDTIAFSGIEAMGEAFGKENPGHIDTSRSKIKPEDLLTLIYTSGTTGNPKGVMLTHANLCSNMIASAESIQLGPTDTLLSFLPLSHSFERMAGYYTALACGCTIAYAESVETVRENMLEVRPTVVTTVPRLFERIYSRVMKQVDAGSAVRRKLFHWAIGVGYKHVAMVKSGKMDPILHIKHAIADRLVFRKLKERTGGRMRFFVSGGAALARKFGEFFEAVGLQIIEGYGLTETSPVIAVNRLESYKFGTVGKTIPGVEVVIAPDDEILVRGPNIMKGYWNNPGATRDSIDDQGWLHTGDIGIVDGDGFLHITDRKKHLFVSSGGKNIAPQPIENLFLSSKYVAQFMLIGDRRMFLTALIVPDFDALKEFAGSRSLPYRNNAELTAHPEIISLIENDIAGIQKDLANFERVRKFRLLEREFTVEEGELTPTQKIRRKVVEEKYAQIIDGMYQGIN